MKMDRLKSALLAIACLTVVTITIGQNFGNDTWNQPDERLLVESKWRYTYTLHTGSNTIIHKAENEYEFFLYFRYDFSYQQYLNGTPSRGTWRLDGRTLHYSFQNIHQFTVAQLSKTTMVLEFTQPNSRGSFQYHFVRVNSQDAPFSRPANELPEVIVESPRPEKKPKEGKRGLFAWLRRGKNRTEVASNPIYINIELVGGGYYGGIDPVLKDYIRIKTDGRLIQEFQSVNTGLLVNKKYINREELEQFIAYVVKQGFFDFGKVYDCTDPDCFKRKGAKPTPNPLRLSITFGNRKKVVTIAIWGEDNKKIQYVNYPAQLDNIIDAIQRMASRLDDPIVKK